MKKCALALLCLCAFAHAQSPSGPQLNLTGNIGCQGFPCLNTGTLNLTTDANYTMSAQDTSALFLKVTSSIPLTATRTLTYPAGRFPVGIENATSGGQALTVCGASGSCVSIPNSTTMYTPIWNDGTNFIQGSGAGGSMTWPAAAGIPNYTGSNSWGTSYNAGNLIPSNFIPTLNQNTTGTAGGLSVALPQGAWSSSTSYTFNQIVTYGGNTWVSIASPNLNQTPATGAYWFEVASGGGSGTVTSFTAGNLSPLFTTSVATGSTTPALTFVLTNAAQNAFLAGPSSGGAGAPGYRALVPADVPTLNQNTTGNAATATALAATPAQCSGGQFATGVASSGAANCATPGVPSDIKWVSASVCDGGSSFTSGFQRYDNNQPVTGCEAAATSTVSSMGFSYNPTQPQYAVLPYATPTYWTGTSLALKFQSTTATTGNYQFVVDVGCVPDGVNPSSVTFGTGTTITTTVNATAGAAFTSALTSVQIPGTGCTAGTTAPGPLLLIRVHRATGDTATDQAIFLGATLVNSRSQ